RLTVNVEAALGTRDVTVTNGGAALCATKPACQELTAPPTVTARSRPDYDDALTQHPREQLITITGTNFETPTTTPSNLVVTFSGTTGNLLIASGPTVAADGTSIQLSVSIAGGAALGAHDVTVTNPDGTSSTLAGAFQVQAPIVAGFALTLPAFADISTYLPS